MSQFIDQEIKGYKVQKPIGEGKFSTVYKAINKEENQSMKYFSNLQQKIFDMMDPKQREKCLKEVKLMQPLDHQNIVKYLDSFLYNNELIIATEWAEKGDLKKLIRTAQADDTPFEELQVWNYIYQIASALQHMHDKRIMHRDLKPANIFIGADGTLKVGDLGLGRIFSSETVEAYSKVGTPLYMSPELLHGEGYDMKSDIWSLGQSFNQNDKMSLVDLFNNITKGEFKPVSNRYSQQLRNVIENMIVVDPLKRLDANTVLQQAKQIFSSHSNTKKTPQILNVLVMEDIYEKLSLAQYHQNFCVPLKKKPISKYFFSLEDNGNQPNKFYYFVDLCYWLMNLPKQKKNKLAQSIKHSQNIEDTAKKLLHDIKVWGIKLPETFGVPYISSCCGDMVCYILNDLLNRELIRGNFKFEQPFFDDEFKSSNILNQEYYNNQQEDYSSESLEDNQDVVEQDDLTSSVMFYQQKYSTEQSYFNSNSQDRQIIQTKIAINEWMNEYNRVEQELNQFQTNIKANNLYLKDYQKTIKTVKQYSKQSTITSKYLRSQEVQDIQQQWISYLEQISKLETQLTNQIQPEFKIAIINNRKTISEFQIHINSLSKSNLLKFEVDKQLIQYLIDKYQRSSLLSDYRPKEKQIINQLKNDIKEMNIKIGIIETQLNKSSVQNSQQLTHPKET